MGNLIWIISLSLILLILIVLFIFSLVINIKTIKENKIIDIDKDEDFLENKIKKDN